MTKPTIESLLTEVGSGLADILSFLEESKGNKGGHEAIVAALSKLSIKAPEVRMSMPAPTVHIAPSDWKKLRIRVSKPAADGSKEFVITKE